MNNQVSFRKITWGLFASLPLALSGAWLFSLLLLRYTDVSGNVMLSPVVNVGPIIISLVVFIIGYAVFMMFLFSENVRGYFSGLLKKN